MGFFDLFRPKWQHSNWTVRSAAVKHLTDQTLLATIARNDSHCDVRMAAMKELTDQAVLAEIAKTDKDMEVRGAAVERLTDQALWDSANEVREMAARYLRELGSDRAVESLITALRSSSEVEARDHAAQALGSIGDERALGPLVEALGDERLGDWDNHKGVESALFALGPIVVEPLINALQSDSYDVSAGAARVLGRLGDKTALNPLIQAASHKRWGVRSEVAKVLAETFGMTQYLERVLRESETDERSKIDIVEYLVQHCGMPGVQVLLRALGDSDDTVFKAAAWGIEYPLLEGKRKGTIKGAELEGMLTQAGQVLTGVVGSAEVGDGARPLSGKVTRAVMTLGSLKYRPALSVLEQLLKKVERQIDSNDVDREYVETEYASGYISSMDTIATLKTAIGRMKE